MGLIPQVLISKGLEATDAARTAVAKVEKLVKQEVITPNKLLREPESDLFEKASYMSDDAFWNDYSNAIMNKANCHKLGIETPPIKSAEESFKYDSQTGRVVEHKFAKDPIQKEIIQFYEDGRTVKTRTKTAGTYFKWVDYYDKSGNKIKYECYSPLQEDGSRRLLERFEYLPDYQRSIKFDEKTGKLLEITTFDKADGATDKYIELNSDGSIKRYLRKGKPVI